MKAISSRFWRFALVNLVGIVAVAIAIAARGYGSTVSLSDGPYEVGEEDVLDEYARAIEIWAAGPTQLRASVDYSIDLRKEPWSTRGR